MFSGALHNFSIPLRKRLETRKVCGPYIHTPAAPGGSRGFYTSGDDKRGRIECDDSGAGFDLRLSYVKNRWGDPLAFYIDPEGMDDTMKAITARLPRSRGFLAGWTLGAGMCAEIELTIYETEEEAARAASYITERAAEKAQWDRIEEDAAREAEEAEEAKRADEIAGLGTEE